jgi:hypothetical protein
VFFGLGAATRAGGQTFLAGVGAGVSMEDGKSGISSGIAPGLSGPDHTGWATGAVTGFDFLPLQWRMVTVGPTVRAFIYEHLDEGSSPHFGYGFYAMRIGGRVQARF